MSKNRIYLAYAVLGLILSITYVYLDLSFREQHEDWMNTPFSTVSPKLFQEPIAKFTIIKIVDLSYDDLIKVFSNVSDYSKILPKNVLNTQILNSTNGIIFSEIEVTEKGISSKFQASQKFDVSEKRDNTFGSRHYVTILTGDAKGTIIDQRFRIIDDSTTEITNGIELRLRGILTPFVFLPENNLKHAANTILDSFIEYAKINTESKKIVDDLYREILLRPADPDGLQYYSSQLESENITPQEIRSFLLESDEKKYLLSPAELKTLDELSLESKKIVDDLYREILLRPADPDGLQYYSSQLESENITPQEIRSFLLESDEKKYLLSPAELKTLDELSLESKKIVDDLYREILLRPADPDGLQYYSSQLESGRMTIDEIKLVLINSSESRVSP